MVAACTSTCVIVRAGRRGEAAGLGQGPCGKSSSAVYLPTSAFPLGSAVMPHGNEAGCKPHRAATAKAMTHSP